MDKREKIERAREIQQGLCRLAEQPKNARNALLSLAERNNPDLVTTDYRYLRIVVEDVDTGERVIPPVYTYRKPGEYDAMLSALVDVTRWPDEILDGLEWGEVVLAGGGRLKRLNFRMLRDKQLLGGRPKGRSAQTEDEYRYLAEWYYRACQSCGGDLSQREFCREAGVSRSKLQKALKFVLKNGP